MLAIETGGVPGFAFGMFFTAACRLSRVFVELTALRVGAPAGALPGGGVGAFVGVADGALPGGGVGAFVGVADGALPGGGVGALVGVADGALPGGGVGALVGVADGALPGGGVGALPDVDARVEPAVVPELEVRVDAGVVLEEACEALPDLAGVAAPPAFDALSWLDLAASFFNLAAAATADSPVAGAIFS